MNLLTFLFSLLKIRLDLFKSISKFGRFLRIFFECGSSKLFGAMCSEKYGENLCSYTTAAPAPAPNRVYTSQLPKPSAEEKKGKELTLFGDLLEDSGTNGVEDQCLVGDSCPSDCESGVSGGENERQPRDSGDSQAGAGGGEMIHGIITKKLVSSLGSSGFEAKVEGIRRVDFSSFMGRAKIQSFCIYSKAVEIKCGGDANVKYGWFGASKREIDSILSHGFCLPTSNGSHGHGVHLSPVDLPIER